MQAISKDQEEKGNNTQGEQREIVLSMQNITKSFGSLKANDNISFNLYKGEVIALLGENGAGKTTLMNILFGHYIADHGKVTLFGKNLSAGDSKATLKAGIGMVHQHFTLAENMLVIENIALGTAPLFSFHFDLKAVENKINALAKQFGLEVQTNKRIADLSVGERQRVEILKALYRDARILILDEPTAVLTPQESDSLFKTLRLLVAKGLSIIFISHKLQEVIAASDRVLVLRGGKLIGERATKTSTMRELATLMVGEEIKEKEITPPQSGAILAKLIGVSLYPKGSTAFLKHINLSLRSGEILGIAGVSGNGQTLLGDILSGMAKPESGELYLFDELIETWNPKLALSHQIGRIPEDRHAVGVIGDMNLIENAIIEQVGSKRFSRFGFIDFKAGKSFVEDIILRYSLKCPSPFIRTRLLSGGNMQKLILGRALDGDPKIIIAIQPTRGLDVGAISFVHDRLLEARARGAAILLITEDLEELRALSDQIQVMSHGRLSKAFNRGGKSMAEIGELMAGHGEFDEKSNEGNLTNAA